MKKGEIYEGVVERIDFPNKGRVHVEGETVTVKNAIPGQKIRFQINKKRKNRMEGRLLEVTEKSPMEKRGPVCSIFPSCGGCMYQTMSYEDQLAMKAGQVKKHLGYPVYGRTLGIIGLGAIGKGMARRALGFGMKVMAYDVFWDEAFAKEHGVQRAELEEIYKEADFITLHCGLNEQTRSMIGAEQLRMMKPSAFLINNARGGLVDEAALNEALRSGEIAGAGIDAFVTEPPIGSPLLELEQVIAAPHVAGSSMDSINNMGVFSARNVVKGFAELEEKQA